MKTIRVVATALAIPFVIASAQQQLASTARVCCTKDTTIVVKDTNAAKPATVFSLLKPIVIQHSRPGDQRGINVFESAKSDNTVPYTGFRLDFGAAFAQEWQGLQHQNSAAPNVVAGVNTNQLMTIGHGFNTELLVGPASQRVVGEGRLRIDRCLTDRRAALQQPDEVHDAQDRTLRDQLR